MPLNTRKSDIWYQVSNSLAVQLKLNKITSLIYFQGEVSIFLKCFIEFLINPYMHTIYCEYIHSVSFSYFYPTLPDYVFPTSPHSTIMSHYLVLLLHM